MDGDSLATDLLVEERIKGDALSADRVEYNSVTKALLDQGLALPKRRSVANTPLSLHVLDVLCHGCLVTYSFDSICRPYDSSCRRSGCRRSDGSLAINRDRIYRRRWFIQHNTCAATRFSR